MSKIFLKKDAIYFHTCKEKLVETKQIAFTKSRRKNYKSYISFYFGKENSRRYLQKYTSMEKRICLMLKDSFCDEGLEDTKPSGGRCFQEGKTKILHLRSHQNHFCFLMHRTSSPNCLSLALNHHYLL